MRGRAQRLLLCEENEVGHGAPTLSSLHARTRALRVPLYGIPEQGKLQCEFSVVIRWRIELLPEIEATRWKLELGPP